MFLQEHIHLATSEVGEHIGETHEPQRYVTYTEPSNLRCNELIDGRQSSSVFMKGASLAIINIYQGAHHRLVLKRPYVYRYSRISVYQRKIQGLNKRYKAYMVKYKGCKAHISHT